MRRLLPLVAAAALGCQNTVDVQTTDATDLRNRTVDADPARREPMLDAVRALEGRWIAETPYGTSEHDFAVSSAGSVVREIMGPGEEHEMTNMYHLDGNTLVMTHYCGAGNQPRMRATGLVDGALHFEADSVSDLKDPDEHYMGSMILRIVSDDVVEQHWISIEAGETSEMGVFTLRRAE